MTSLPSLQRATMMMINYLFIYLFGREARTLPHHAPTHHAPHCLKSFHLVSPGDRHRSYLRLLISVRSARAPSGGHCSSDQEGLPTTRAPVASRQVLPLEGGVRRQVRSHRERVRCAHKRRRGEQVARASRPRERQAWRAQPGSTTARGGARW